MTDEIMYTERAPRFPIDTCVNCDGDKLAYSKNISESGIALLAEAEFVEGQFLQLKFMLPGSAGDTSAYGKVVRSTRVSDNFREYGIQFWDIEDEVRKKLDAFFQSQEMAF